MERFSHTFLQYIQKEDILILALSGGVDSMALIDITLQLHPLSNIIVAHFDHSLRGAESDGDSQFIADFCHSRNIIFEVEKMNIAHLAKMQKMSIESGARKYRYEFLFRMREKYEAKYILTAHHLDDRIETAVFNLLRGTKLRGIHALSDISLQGIFRPLITCTKKEILRYARENNIIYREDSSNASNDYLRNQLRHDIIPKFEQINPEFRSALSNFIEYTEVLNDWIDDEVGGFLGGKKRFALSDFRLKSLFFQKELIRYLYEQANHGTIGLSEGNIEEMLRYILTAHGGTRKIVNNLSLQLQKSEVSYEYL